MALLAVTALVLSRRQSSPYLLTGWLWYMVMLAPVIGMIQVGDQAYADRYTYTPLIGLFLIFAWAVPEVLYNVWPLDTKLVTGGAVVILMVLSVLSYGQVGVWENSVTLFEHAIKVVPHNYLAEHELGTAYARDGRFADALPHMRTAVALKPNWPVARFNLAVVLYKNGNYEDAAVQASAAERVGFKPETPEERDSLKEIRSRARTR
jgi:tetratricopeptide (TPR) repeat protein